MTTAEKIQEGCGKMFDYGVCGFNRWICGKTYYTEEIVLCPSCKIQISQYKSDLQQELAKWEEVYAICPPDEKCKECLEIMPKIKKWINLIQKELQELEKND